MKYYNTMRKFSFPMLHGGASLAIKGMIGCAVAGLLATSAAWAGPYISRGPFVSPIASPYIPHPREVPGKEYVDYVVDPTTGDLVNKDDTGAPKPLQNIAWDGAGGIVNSFNWSGTFQNPAGAAIPDPGKQVDAMANLGDALFREVIANQAALLLSATTDPRAPVLVEPISGCGAGPCPIWATAADIDQHGVHDLVGLEVWGPETPNGVGQDDTNRISLAGDPLGVAVWACGAPGPCVPQILDADVALAIGLSSTSQIDLDALMFQDPDELLFSIRPFGPYDGGEIWHWNTTTGAIAFLRHGGHLWDTANCVTCLIGHEDVDAIEAIAAIPEPGTWLLLTTGLVGLLGYGWRRRKQTV